MCELMLTKKRVESWVVVMLNVEKERGRGGDWNGARIRQKPPGKPRQRSSRHGEVHTKQ